MDGVHDMGGMHGFGPVVRPGSERTHNERWEIRAQVLSLLSNRSSRALIEEMEPHEYLSTDYYGRWLSAAERGALTRGVEEADLVRWRDVFIEDPTAAPPVATDPERLGRIRDYLSRPFPIPPARDPRFGPGDRVRVRRDRIEAHHRCPRYVRGVQGTIERVCGDDRPAGGQPGSDDELEAFYTVRFSSVDLWGAGTGEPEFALYIDLWQSYLEPT